MIDPKQRAIDALVEKYRQQLRLVPVDTLPAKPYYFDPAGWLLFWVDVDVHHKVGDYEYVAIHRRRGVIRYLGTLGD